MGLKFAYDAVDPQCTPITLKDWLAHHRGAMPKCLICHEDLKIGAPRSQTISTYFSHKQNSLCPTVSNSPPSSSIGRATTVPGAASAAKAHARKHLMGVYMSMRMRVPIMRWRDVEDACVRAKQLGVWNLVGLTPEYVPWVLLSCVDKWSGGATGKDEVAFFLEPNVQGGGPWDFSGARKRFLHEVDLKTGALTPHVIPFVAPNGDILTRIDTLLA